MRETGFFRGSGGAVWEMDLPLNPDMQKQLEKGQLVRVNEDGSTFSDFETFIDGFIAEGDDPDANEDDLDPEHDPDVTPELAAFLNDPPEAPAPSGRKRRNSS